MAAFEFSDIDVKWFISNPNGSVDCFDGCRNLDEMMPTIVQVTSDFSRIGDTIAALDLGERMDTNEVIHDRCLQVVAVAIAALSGFAIETWVEVMT